MKPTPKHFPETDRLKSYLKLEQEPDFQVLEFSPKFYDLCGVRRSDKALVYLATIKKPFSLDLFSIL